MCYFLWHKHQWSGVEGRGVAWGGVGSGRVGWGVGVGWGGV